MKPIITDLTNSSPSRLKPIELKSCLQGDRNENNKYHFYPSNYQDHLKAADKITRLATVKLDKKYDVIETDIKGTKNIFLGHWNDGVV